MKVPSFLPHLETCSFSRAKTLARLVPRLPTLRRRHLSSADDERLHLDLRPQPPHSFFLPFTLQLLSFLSLQLTPVTRYSHIHPLASNEVAASLRPRGHRFGQQLQLEWHVHLRTDQPWDRHWLLTHLVSLSIPPSTLHLLHVPADAAWIRTTTRGSSPAGWRTFDASLYALQYIHQQSPRFHPPSIQLVAQACQLHLRIFVQL